MRDNSCCSKPFIPRQDNNSLDALRSGALRPARAGRCSASLGHAWLLACASHGPTFTQHSLLMHAWGLDFSNACLLVLMFGHARSLCCTPCSLRPGLLRHGSQLLLDPRRLEQLCHTFNAFHGDVERCPAG